jgi:hypothetical protein
LLYRRVKIPSGVSHLPYLPQEDFSVGRSAATFPFRQPPFRSDSRHPGPRPYAHKAAVGIDAKSRDAGRPPSDLKGHCKHLVKNDTDARLTALLKDPANLIGIAVSRNRDLTTIDAAAGRVAALDSVATGKIARLGAGRRLQKDKGAAG